MSHVNPSDYPHMLKGWKPYLNRKAHENNRWETEELQVAVGYHQGFNFTIVAVFSDADHADTFAETLNKAEGYNLYVPVILIPETLEA